jgi:hypothetical protein
MCPNFQSNPTTKLKVSTILQYNVKYQSGGTVSHYLAGNEVH